MAGKVHNIMVCRPLKLYHGLTGKYHAICHYSYNLPLCTSKKITHNQFIVIGNIGLKNYYCDWIIILEFI